MTNKETVERNIGLTFDFVKHLIDNPEDLQGLPGNFSLEFAEKDFVNKKVKSENTVSMKKSQVVRVRNTFEFSKGL
jgi:hypothetical protein